MDAEIGARILAAIETAGVTAASVKEAAGISEGVWARSVMHGHEALRVPALIRIARVLNVPVGDLLPEEAAA